MRAIEHCCTPDLVERAHLLKDGRECRGALRIGEQRTPGHDTGTSNGVREPARTLTWIVLAHQPAGHPREPNERRTRSRQTLPKGDRGDLQHGGGLRSVELEDLTEHVGKAM